jgi:hypothetical protein
MGIKNISICDRCSKEQESSEQMWWVGTHISSYSYGSKGNEYALPLDKQLWCRSCAINTGFMVRTKPENGAVTPTPEPTLEDKLRQVIGQIVQEEMEAK